MYSPDSDRSYSGLSGILSDDYLFLHNSSSYDYDSYSDIIDRYQVVENVRVKKEKNAVTKVIEEEAYCFDDQKFARKLINATYIEANKFLTLKKEYINPENIPCDGWSDLNFEETDTSAYETESVTTFWPKISDFTIKLGMEKVEQFVDGWERSSDWKYCVEFVGFECEDCSNIFVFQVEWSKPTMTYPIPQATANVFFALDVYKMVPYNYYSRVEVTYIFECSTVIHRPGRIDFQEKWLEDILQAKLAFFKTITFSVSNDLLCSNKKNYKFQI